MTGAFPRRVLLVSHTADERERYAASVRGDGFRTLQASTAVDAIRLASGLPPDAVVTDVQLSGAENGLQFARRLKKSPGNRCGPFVVLTGEECSHDHEAAARARCDLFLAKPFPEALSRVVAGLIGRRSRGGAADESASKA